MNSRERSELIANSTDRDDAAWRRLVLRYESLVYSVAKLYTADRKVVEFIFYDVMVEFYSRLDTLRDTRGLPAWFVSVTRRKGKEAHRNHPVAQPLTDGTARVKSDLLLQRFYVEEALEGLSPPDREFLEQFQRALSRRDFREAVSGVDLDGDDVRAARARCLLTVASHMGRTPSHPVAWADMKHLCARQMVDLIDGRVGGRAAESLRSHVAACPRCANDLARLGRIMDALSRPSLEHAPTEVLDRVFAIFHRDQRQVPRIVRTVASLVMDSWMRTAMAGFRGFDGPRHLSLMADEFDVHVAIENGNGGYIRGQLLARRSVGFIGEFDVVLMNAESEILDSAIANEFGEFNFDGVGKGASRISIQLREGATIRNISCDLPQEESR